MTGVLSMATSTLLLNVGHIGGYPIPQCRTKNWQISKYRVENGRNTDTAFMIGDAYLTLYPSRMFFYVKHVGTRNQPQPSREKREKILN